MNGPPRAGELHTRAELRAAALRAGELRAAFAAAVHAGVTQVFSF